MRTIRWRVWIALHADRPISDAIEREVAALPTW
jgi:hypothetical protein